MHASGYQKTTVVSVACSVVYPLGGIKIGGVKGETVRTTHAVVYN